ncbi:MAG: hypothetical protein M1813_007189 [Trichoglossum hirsutum]|nr:MAG: hypothetical protein M1813_007189 [Trichoglossum hirsutum]
MPTFHSIGTSVQLSVPDVFRMSTTGTSNRHSTDNAGGRLEGLQCAENEYVLPEESLFELDRLEFLGKRKDMPFFLVRVGRDLFKLKLETGGGSSAARRQIPVRTPSPGETKPLASSPDMASGTKPAAEPTEQATRRSSFGRLIKRKGSPPSTPPPILPKTSEPGAALSTRIAPLPLTLTVTFRPPSWADPRMKVFPLDFKIDVFLNGEFTASRIILARHREAGWGGISEVFSGRRVSLKQERVWVLVPPGQNADGTLREHKRAKNTSHSAAERWTEIGRALQEESDRWGQDVWGERSCVGEYLEHLAKVVELPKGLEQIEKPGGQKFSIVDVVVCVGKVGKRETYFLKAPERSTDPRFFNLSEENSKNVEINQTSLLRSAPSPAKGIASSGDKFALQDSTSPYPTSSAIIVPQPVPPPPFRHGTPKARSAPTLPLSAERNRTIIPDPLKLNDKYSAEQKRRLQDLALVPARPRQQFNIIPADISHSHPVEASFTPVTPSNQRVRESITAVQSHRLQEAEDESPSGKPENLPQKRYRYSNEKTLKTPVKKRKSKMDDLSSTLKEGIWGVGAVATKYGVTPADAPAMSTRSRGRSCSDPASDRNAPEATAQGNPNRSSRPPSREASAVERQTPRITRYRSSPKVDSNASFSAQPAATRSAKPNPPSVTERRQHHPTANRNALAVQLTDPFCPPLPKTDKPWRPSPLSQDAVLAYAEGNAWEGSVDQQIQRVVSDIPVKKGDVAYRGERMDGVREVRAERLAGFEEASILMGVRFVVEN